MCCWVSTSVSARQLGRRMLPSDYRDAEDCEAAAQNSTIVDQVSRSSPPTSHARAMTRCSGTTVRHAETQKKEKKKR